MNKPDDHLYGKVPPQAPEIEEALLGALISEPDSYFRIQVIIKPEHFYRDEHQKIFNTIAEMHHSGKSVDLVTLAQRMKETNIIEEIGGPLKLTGLMGKVSGAYNIEHYAKIIADNYFRRAAIVTANKIQQLAYDNCDPEEITDVWNEYEKEMISVFDGNNTGNDLVNVLVETLAEIEKRQLETKTGKTPGITTGFKKLDLLTTGWRENRLIVIGGRPGHGKTSVALHFASEAAKYRIPVIFFSLEMSKTDLAEIMLIGKSGISRTAISNGKFSDSDYSNLHNAAGLIQELKIFFYDNPDLSINQIVGIIKAQIRKRGKCLVIIDYLQLVKPEKTTKGQIREQQIAEISRALKRLTLSEKIPIILLSQLNRNSEREEPLLSHLRESGAIEQDADMVLFVWKPAKDNYDSPDNLIRLKVAKNRHGRLGILDIYENGEMTKFSEYPFPKSGIKSEDKELF